MARKRKCLMIETRDNRRFFTEEKNYIQLIEFSKTFGAELSIVKAEDPPVLDLVSLAPALCNISYEITNPSFDVIEVKVPHTTRKRTTLRKHATTIRKWIKKTMLEGKPLRTAKIAQHYQKYELTKSCFCTHFAEVRQELEKEGHTIKKVGHGVYQCGG